MSAHTPGPWHISGPFNNETFRVSGSHTLYLEVRPDPDGYVIGANEPNARLIAAAPDLLSEFKRVMSWIDNWSPEFSNDPDWPTDRDAARAAIAKATGEAT